MKKSQTSRMLSNHVIIAALPHRLRERMLVSAAERDVFEKLDTKGRQMKRSVKLFPLMVLGVFTVSSAWAGPKEEVAAATAKWADIFAQNNPDTISVLYAKDGVLWGTLSPTVRSDPAGIRAYFVAAFGALPKATVSFGDQLVRVLGNTAINTGYYTFSYVKDGETKSIPARYSLTYVKDGENWLIADHHSSAMPLPPIAPSR